MWPVRGCGERKNRGRRIGKANGWVYVLELVGEECNLSKLVKIVCIAKMPFQKYLEGGERMIQANN